MLKKWIYHREKIKCQLIENDGGDPIRWKVHRSHEQVFCWKKKTNFSFFFFTTLHYRRTDLVGCCGLRFGRSTGTLPDTVGRCACNARPICAMRCTLWARYTVWDVPFTRKQVVKVVDLSQQVPPKGTYRIIASEGFEAFDPIQRSRVAHPLDGLPVGD